MQVIRSARFSGLIFVALLLLNMFVWAEPIFAGDGKFNGTTIDINVLLDVNNTWTDADLSTYFTRISEELYDATEKQVQLGKVNIYKGILAKNKADLLVSKKIPGAYTYANKFGTAGDQGRIYLSENDVSSSVREVVTHEMGHAVFGMYDSYLGYLQETVTPFRYWGPINNGSSLGWQNSKYLWNPNTVSSGTIGVNLTDIFYDNINPASKHIGSCIMDGPWPFSPGPKETEFSTPSGNGWATDHLIPTAQDITMKYNGKSYPFKAKVITMQNDLNNNESAWETMKKTRNLTIPTSPPTSDKTGHQPIDLHVVPSMNQLSVCIDRSGSMDGTPLTLAKIGAGLVVYLAHDEYDIPDPSNGIPIPIAGDYLSVTAYDNTTMTVYSTSGKVGKMTLLNKATAIAAIAPLSSGNMTSIGGGLTESQNTFLTTDSFQKSIILLTDGQENTPPWISDVLPSLLADNIRVYTIGLGSGVNVSLLQDLAGQTGGEFFYADNAFQLPGIFSTMYAELRNDGIQAAVGGVLNASTSNAIKAKSPTLQNTKYTMISPPVATSLSDHINSNLFGVGNPAASTYSKVVKVDSSTLETTFLVTWDLGQLSVTLLDPHGNNINPTNYTALPNVYYQSGTGFVMYRIKSIEAGDWTVQITNTGSDNAQWELRAFAVDGNVQFSAFTDKTKYTYPGPVIIKASCAAPQPVIGGHATATVRRPDASFVVVNLFDDGNTANGDESANDGVYSGKFDSFLGDGVYTVTVNFDSTGAVTPTPDNSNNIVFSLLPPGTPPVNPPHR